jgi:integrase
LTTGADQMTKTNNVIQLPVADLKATDAKPKRHRAVLVNLTTERIDSIPSNDKRQRIPDATVTGLHLVVTAKGAKSFVVRGRIGKGRNRPVIDVAIGSTLTTTLKFARECAKDILADMRRGVDPRQQTATELSVADLVTRYIERQELRGIATVDKIQLGLARITTGLGQQPAHTVTKAQWADAVSRVHKKYGFAPASDAAKDLRAMSRWADDAGLLENSSAMRIKGPTASNKDIALTEKRKAERWTLRQSDWATFWVATEAASDPVFRDYLRLLMVTGLRRREASLARWADIDLDKMTWRIPPENAKTAREHIIYLGPLSSDILRNMAKGDLVFPGRRGPLVSWTYRIKAISDAFGAKVMMHGLRRGYRTTLAEMRVPADVAERMLAHARPSLVERYDLADLPEERRAAQTKLEQAVMEAVL